MSDVDAWIDEQTELTSLAEAERAVAKAKRVAREARAAKRRALHDLEVATNRADLALALSGSPKPAVVKSRGKRISHEATAVIMCSDWHVEEVVDPAKVSGRNEYNPAIAEKRVGNLIDASTWMLDRGWKGWDVRDVVLWLGGDLISGYIHEELLETNAMSPVEAVLLAARFSGMLLDALVDTKGVAQVSVVCNHGNHGRTKPKRQVANAAENSFEWLMYKMLAQQYADDDRVSFDIAPGAHAYAEIYGATYHFHHGDHVRYGGGVGGLSIPLLKKVDRWQSVRRSDCTIIGHYHQLKDFGRAMVNGSLIGWNEFAMSIGAEYEEPRQGMFLVDRDWGRRGLESLYVEDRRGAA